MKPSDYIAKKRRQVGQIESLRNLCQKCLIDNRCKIKNVGEVPRDLLLPVLERCSADQLWKIEGFNPGFILEDEFLWSKLFEADFPGSAKSNNQISWREAYIQAKAEREKKLEGVTAKLKKSYDQASEGEDLYGFLVPLASFIE
jgi:elongin-A